MKTRVAAPAATAEVSEGIAVQERSSPPVLAPLPSPPPSSPSASWAIGKRALVFSQDRLSGTALVRALQSAAFEVDWVRTDVELESRAARSDLPTPAVVFMVPSQNTANDARLLAELAYRSCYGEAQRAPGDRTRYLEGAVRSYAANRLLSERQQRILGLYLEGKGDKEIADICGCSEATVYEHWRRIARKAGGQNKGDSISDFHRFLGAEGSPASGAL